MQAKREVEISGVTYEKIDAIEQSKCTGCVAMCRDDLCSVLGNDCFNAIWIKKEQTMQPQETQTQPEVTQTEEPKYTVEVLEAVEEAVEEVVDEYFAESQIKWIKDFLAKKNNPDYKLYLELKAKFGE